MAKWKVDGKHIYVGDNHIVTCSTPEIAAQIVQEHNSHDALMKACRIGLKSFNSAIKALSTAGVVDDEVVGLQNEITGRIEAALALAEGE